MAVADPVVTEPPVADASFEEFMLAFELDPEPFRLMFPSELFEARPPKALLSPVVAFVATVFAMFVSFVAFTLTSLVLVFVVVSFVVSLFVCVSVFVSTLVLMSGSSQDHMELWPARPLKPTDPNWSERLPPEDVLFEELFEEFEELFEELFELLLEPFELLFRNEGSETETALTPATFKTLLPAVASPVRTVPPSARAVLFDCAFTGSLPEVRLLSFTFIVPEFEATPPEAVLPPVEALVVTLFVTLAVFSLDTRTVFVVVFVTVVV